MRIALFDLDHTLIPFDASSVFTRHLEDAGVLDASFHPRYLEYCRRYAEGTVDMAEMHRFVVGELAVHTPAVLAEWLDEFAVAIAERVPKAALELVAAHRGEGHACALVTATSRFIAEPFARVFGLDDVLATEPAVGAGGRYTGEVVGLPCFREHKIAHVEAWLARRGATWDDLDRSWFYSDSFNDLPLLLTVTDPIVVDPDPMLRAEAEARGWHIKSLRGPGRGG
jgi:HAD superfamily hydrolase (TIGR01490 family)